MLRTLSLALLIAAGAGAANAQTGRFAVGGQVGTTGLGVEGQFQASEMITFRAAGDLFRYEDDYQTQDVRYDGEADFSTLSAFVDLHPFRNSFFLSAGGFFGERRVEIVGTPTRDAVIAGQVFPPERLGQIVGEADFGSAAPFVGIGFNNTFRTGGRLGFKLLIGAAFGESPLIELRRQGGDPLPPGGQAEYEEELEIQEDELEDDLSNFETLPVAQVGLTFRF